MAPAAGIWDSHGWILHCVQKIPPEPVLRTARPPGSRKDPKCSASHALRPACGAPVGGRAVRDGIAESDEIGLAE